ncbi:unnamed protein product, partial [Sphacelaria rigidula]
MYTTKRQEARGNVGAGGMWEGEMYDGGSSSPGNAAGRRSWEASYRCRTLQRTSSVTVWSWYGGVHRILGAGPMKRMCGGASGSNEPSAHLPLHCFSCMYRLNITCTRPPRFSTRKALK